VGSIEARVSSWSFGGTEMRYDTEMQIIDARLQTLEDHAAEPELR